MAAEAAMRHIRLKLKHFLRDRRGFAAIEFAFIGPILVLVYFGTVDIANWYSAHRRLVVAGSTIADLTTQSQAEVTKETIDKFWTGMGPIVAPVDISKVTMTMQAFRKDSNGVNPLWPHSVSGGVACSNDKSPADLAAMGTDEMSDGNDILVVAVCAEIAPLVPLQIFNFDKLKLRYQISMRPRLGKKLDCTNCLP
jgi:hypothetical protein